MLTEIDNDPPDQNIINVFYNTKLHAILLSILVILVIIGIPIAFSGGAAAVAAEDVDLASDQMPGVVYPGQIFDVTTDAPVNNFSDEAYLVEISRDAGDVDGFSLVSTLEAENTNGPAGQETYEINTTSTVSGSEYAIASNSTFRGAETTIQAVFATSNEGFDATFDAGSISDTDDRSSIELGNDRPNNNYNITVQSSYLDYEQLKDLFNVTGSPGGSDDAEVTREPFLPLNGSFGPTAEDGDGLSDLKDEGALTLDLSTLSQDERLQGDKLGIYPENLANGEGFPGGGEYDFEFRVTDTNSVATDTVYVNTDGSIPPVYDFQIPNDGDVYTVGFPAPLDGTVSEALNEPSQDLGAQTTVYVYENGGWVNKNTANIEPDALDAIAIVTDGDDGEDVINMEMEFETTNTPTPGDIDVSEGWNFVAAPSYAPADEVFNVGQTREVFNPFDDPPSDRVRAAENFLNYRMGSASTPEVSPFTGYFIYSEEADAIQTGLAGGVEGLPQADNYLNTSG